MDLNLVVTILLVVLTGIILHFRNMIKFVLLGLFVGWVLARVVGNEFYSLVSGIELFSADVTLAIAKNVLLLVPATILGFNHLPGKGKSGLVKSIMMSFVTVLFLFASIIEFLPEALQVVVLDESIVASQISHTQFWITLLAVGMLVIDSFHHKAAVQKDKILKKHKK